MELGDLLSAFGGTLLGRLPLLIVYTVGIFIAVARWQRHRRVSLLLTIGLLILMVNSVAGAFLDVYLPIALFEGGTHPPRIGLILSLRSILQALVAVVGWVLVLMAVFADREEYARLEPESFE